MKLLLISFFIFCIFLLSCSQDCGNNNSCSGEAKDSIIVHSLDSLEYDTSFIDVLICDTLEVGAISDSVKKQRFQ